MTTSKKPQTMNEKLADSHYQPTRSELSVDVSVRVAPERLAQAALKGGAPRRETGDTEN